MSTMSFPIVKLSQSLVAPHEPTPSGTLPLSSIDRHPSHRVWIDTLHIFKHGVEPAKVIREALSRALVPYYPLAGRFSESVDGELEIALTGEGIWFAEATAEFSLEDVNYLERPLMVERDDLLASPPRPVQDLKNMIILIQITQFNCGGFVMGLKFNHAVADGLGASQFIEAIADFARGLPHPTTNPVWLRSSIPNPKHNAPHQPNSPPPNVPLQHLSIDITPDQINALKDQYMSQTSRRCSTFDVLFAKVWQCRTQAIGLDSDIDLLLHFFADARRLLGHVLPAKGGGYYGNCIYPVKVTAKSGKLVSDSLVEVVNVIRDAKEALPVEFAKWAEGELEEDPNKIEFNYQSFFVADWSRVNMAGVDYGWGPPIYVGPLLTDDHTIPMCVLLKPPVPKVGARLMTWCVEPRHFEVFREKMMKWD